MLAAYSNSLMASLWTVDRAKYAFTRYFWHLRTSRNVSPASRQLLARASQPTATLQAQQNAYKGMHQIQLLELNVKSNSSSWPPMLPGRVHIDSYILVTNGYRRCNTELSMVDLAFYTSLKSYNSKGVTRLKSATKVSTREWTVSQYRDTNFSEETTGYIQNRATCHRLGANAP